MLLQESNWILPASIGILLCCAIIPRVTPPLYHSLRLVNDFVARVASCMLYVYATTCTVLFSAGEYKYA